MGRLYNQARRRREPKPVEPWVGTCPICDAEGITHQTAHAHLAQHGLFICRGPREFSRQDFVALAELHGTLKAEREEDAS